MRWLFVLCLCFSFVSCASAPPSLTPVGVAAFNARRVVKSLDLIRDVAVDAEANKVLSTDTTRRVVVFHRSSLETIRAVPNGWKSTVLAAIEEVPKNLPDKERMVLAPYLALTKTLILEVVGS
jgi:hypothetical protein